MPGLPVTLVDGPVGGADRDGRGARVVVVFERGDSGTAALREAAELASAGRDLTVLTLAPQARPYGCGRAGGEGLYNIAVREEAALELREARESLGSVADRTRFMLLAGCPQPPLASWVAEQRVGLVLLPHQRLTRGGHLFSRSLRKKTSAEVRLVRRRRGASRSWFGAS